MNAYYQLAQHEAARQGGLLIAFANEKDSRFMYVAIAKFNHEYAVWNYNGEFNGFYNGYYTTDIDMAYQMFAKRLTK
jgi:hypothetical protein